MELHFAPRAAPRSAMSDGATSRRSCWRRRSAPRLPIRRGGATSTGPRDGGPPDRPAVLLTAVVLSRERWRWYPARSAPKSRWPSVVPRLPHPGRLHGKAARTRLSHRRSKEQHSAIISLARGRRSPADPRGSSSAPAATASVAGCSSTPPRAAPDASAACAPAVAWRRAHSAFPSSYDELVAVTGRSGGRRVSLHPHAVPTSADRPPRRWASDHRAAAWRLLGASSSAQNVGHVDARGLRADHELAGDLSVGETAGDQRQHLRLAVGEPGSSSASVGTPPAPGGSSRARCATRSISRMSGAGVRAGPRGRRPARSGTVASARGAPAETSVSACASGSTRRGAVAPGAPTGARRWPTSSRTRSRGRARARLRRA